MFNIKDTKIITYPNFTFNQEYRIDKYGNVWSPYRGWHLLKKQLNKSNYYRIGLMVNENKRKFFMIHRLVLETFSPIENSEKYQVNHIDGNKMNNNLDNLEWVTPSENIIHAKNSGLLHRSRGINVKGSILKENQVLEICDMLLNKDKSLAEIGKIYGVSRYCIHDIKRKKSWAWLTNNYIFN